MQMTDQSAGDAPILSQSQVAQYQRDGFVVARQILTSEEARQWKAVLKERLIEEGTIDEPSGVQVWMALDMDELTAEYMQDSRFVGAIQQLIGPDVEFLSVKAVFKNARTRFASPWHIDWFYWGGASKISIWIALDDADPDNGCLQMIPGSHRQAVERHEIDDGKGFSYRITEEQIAGMPVETVAVKRGDAIFFHDRTLHASCPNTSGRERWCAISTYRSGAEKDESPVWQTALVLSGNSVNV